MRLPSVGYQLLDRAWAECNHTGLWAAERHYGVMRCGGRHQCRSAGAKSPANARSCASSLPTSPALSIQFTSQEMQERRDALACSAPNLQVFPGQGPEDQNRTFPGGISNVTASFGQFLDNFMGVGGTGTNNVRCSPTWPGLHACLCCHSHSHALQQAVTLRSLVHDCRRRSISADQARW